MVTSRHEPGSFDELENLAEFQDTRQLFEAVGWIEFFKQYDGFDNEVALQFARSFNGHRVVIQGLELIITEEFMARAVCLPRTGERWFKGNPVAKASFNQFLIPEYRDPYWSCGIPNTWLSEQWGKVLHVLQKIVTCEGRFDTVFIYHARLMLHIEGSQPMNVPYYLLQTLIKMSAHVQKATANLKGSLSHHGLIKILVSTALRVRNMTWEACLHGNLKQGKPRKTGSEPQMTKTMIVAAKQSRPNAATLSALTPKISEQPMSTTPVGPESKLKSRNSEQSVLPKSNKRSKTLFPPTVSQEPKSDYENVEKEHEKCSESPEHEPESSQGIHSSLKPFELYSDDELDSFIDDLIIKLRAKTEAVANEENLFSSPVSRHFTRGMAAQLKVTPTTNIDTQSGLMWSLTRLLEEVRKRAEEPDELGKIPDPEKSIHSEEIQSPQGNVLDDLHVNDNNVEAIVDRALDNVEDSVKNDIDCVENQEIHEIHKEIHSQVYENVEIHTVELTPTTFAESRYEVSSNKKEYTSVARLLRRNLRLKEKLQEVEILNCHVKTENELCKTQNAHLQAKVERIKVRHRKLYKNMRKVQSIARRHCVQIRTLKKKIHQLQTQVLINSQASYP